MYIQPQGHGQAKGSGGYAHSKLYAKLMVFLLETNRQFDRLHYDCNIRNKYNDFHVRQQHTA
jgi:hypothetical protein